MASSIIGFSHVNLIVADLAAAKRFYRGLLGLEEVPRAEGGRRDGAWYRIGAGAELHLSEEPGRAPVTTDAHFAMRVDSLANVVDAFARAGWPTVPGRDVPGMVRCFVRDPSGNLIELQELEAAPTVRMVIRPE